eukprot:tig00021464_g21728.t1
MEHEEDLHEVCMSSPPLSPPALLSGGIGRVGIAHSSIPDAMPRTSSGGRAAAPDPQLIGREAVEINKALTMQLSGTLEVIRREQQVNSQLRLRVKQLEAKSEEAMNQERACKEREKYIIAINGQLTQEVRLLTTLVSESERRAAETIDARAKAFMSAEKDLQQRVAALEAELRSGPPKKVPELTSDDIDRLLLEVREGHAKETASLREALAAAERRAREAEGRAGQAQRTMESLLRGAAYAESVNSLRGSPASRSSAGSESDRDASS